MGTGCSSVKTRCADSSVRGITRLGLKLPRIPRDSRFSLQMEITAVPGMGRYYPETRAVREKSCHPMVLASLRGYREETSDQVHRRSAGSEARSSTDWSSSSW